MFEISGQNYIGGTRRSAGSVILQSHDASTGEALPYHFFKPPRMK